MRGELEVYLEPVCETCEHLLEAAGHSWRADHVRDSVEIATRGYVEVFLANTDVLRLLCTIANADDRYGSLLRESRERFVQRIEGNLVRGQEPGCCCTARPPAPTRRSSRGAKVRLIATAGHGGAILAMRGSGRTAGLPVRELPDVTGAGEPARPVLREIVARERLR